jgi:hypothetical protein
MTNDSTRFRAGPATSLRDGRKTKNAGCRSVQLGVAASYKTVTLNDEQPVDANRSRKRTPNAAKSSEHPQLRCTNCDAITALILLMPHPQLAGYQLLTFECAACGVKAEVKFRN